MSFVLQITAAVGLTTALSWRNGQKAVDDLASQLSEKAANRIREHVQTYLLQPNLLQRDSRSNLFYGDVALSNSQAIARHFWHQIRASDGITSIYLGYPNGTFVGIQERNNGQTVLWEVTPETQPQRLTYRLNEAGERREQLSSQFYDPRGRPWYQAVVKNRHASWSPIYKFASQDYSVLGITLAAPIHGDRGKLQGVLALDLTLEQISSYLRTLNISPNGEAFIIERTGDIVATSADELPFLTLASGEQTRLPATASQEPIIREAAQYLIAEYGSLEQVNTAQQFTYDLAGQDQLVQIVPFRDGRGLDWLIVTAIPEADFKGQIAENTRNTLLLCLLSLIVAGIIAGITARWVAQPIHRLSAASKKLAVGTWDSPLPNGRFQELSELSYSFESMAQQLKQSFQQLEDHNYELKRLDKLKDEFLANTSHELRTPLNGIIGLAESLIDGASGPQTRQTKGNLAMIVASGKRLSALVDDILDFAQLQQDRVEIHPRPVGVREAAEVVLTLSRPLAREKKVQLVNAVSPKLPPVLADENRLQQILHNLVGNAVKFTDYGMVGISAQIIRQDEGQLVMLSANLPSICPRPQPVDEFLSAAGAHRVAGKSLAQPDDNDHTRQPLSASGVTPSLRSTTKAADSPAEVAAETAGYYLAITVSDTGIGIPEDKLEGIFEPFVQADGSTSRVYGGMGIGLAVSQKLVELQGGTFQVLSAVGVGSQFTFTLPITTQAHGLPLAESDWSTLTTERSRFPIAGLPLELPPIAPAPAVLETEIDSSIAVGSSANDVADAVLARSNFSILVVDDEPINRQVIRNHLAVHNYRVIQAGSGPEALALLENGLQPDAILLDVMMPQMTGFEVCRKLRETYPAHVLPIMMLTAKNQVGDLVSGLSAGANDYLTKPISKDELLARLKTHLYLAKINQAYGRFVPREFLQFLDKESIVEVELGNHVERQMSVVFADIRDFTTLSEQMSPEDNFKFLNAFLSRMEPAIAEHHGFVDKYIGDAIMALFSRGADDALQAAIEMLRRLEIYNEERSQYDKIPLEVGIGINTGKVMLGTVGGRNRMDSTAISDTVNVAARIERMTRIYSANLLISHHTFLALSDSNQYAMRVIDRVQVKGKVAYVSVYEVFEPDAPTQREGKLKSRTDFETGLAYFYQNRFADAQQRFQRCLDICPTDKVAESYYERCTTLLQPL
ncbi:response regulator [Halomicronema sp. CCY15110]|uniref:response regulator n=1 Tax=Halomicronema sp. CCY15110 TaxID=2767773 RepID=UPI0019514923|nr:response regulator [Halomicronema sp. CCY15110]